MKKNKKLLEGLRHFLTERKLKTNQLNIIFSTFLKNEDCTMCLIKFFVKNIS